MTIILCMVLAQMALVAGQVSLKRGMGKVSLSPRPTKKIIANVAVGTTFLTLWFLLWMRLLQKVELSYIYPFEGISPILLAFAAWILLKEKVTRKSWIGVGLIGLGTLLVGLS